MEFIDLKTQYTLYKKEIDSRIKTVLDHGKFIMGPEVFEIEDDLVQYTGAKHCITTSSGTHSIEIAFRALDIGPGDEVITSPFTWISSAETIMLVGAKPVFIDIDPDTFNVDTSKIEQAITENTKAILPISLFGQTADLTEINKIASDNNLYVIEDAAQSFGATHHKIKSCNLSLAASTSFFPAKPLGCYGDGGALFTNNDELASKMRAIRTHGGIDRNFHQYLGTNGRFDTIQAAILLAKFPFFQEEIKLRNEVAKKYDSLLSDTVKTPVINQNNTSVFAQYTIRTDTRDKLSKKLEEQKIPSSVYYPKCLHEQPVFAFLDYTWGDFPEAEKASREVISLPMHPFLEDQMLEEVSSVIIDFFR